MADMVKPDIFIKECIESALAALGTGNCSVNTCRGCKQDEADARGYLQDALRALEKRDEPLRGVNGSAYWKVRGLRCLYSTM